MSVTSDPTYQVLGRQNTKMLQRACPYDGMEASYQWARKPFYAHFTLFPENEINFSSSAFFFSEGRKTEPSVYGCTFHCSRFTSSLFFMFLFFFVLRNFVSGKISQFFFADLGQSSGCVRVGVALRMTQWNIIKYVACPQRGRDTFAYTTMASGETGAYVDILLIFEHKFYLSENDDEIEK